MDDNDMRPHGTQPPVEKDGLLILVLVFLMRCGIVFIYAFARSIVIVAGNRIPESLFDHPFITGFLTELLPSNARERRARSRASQTATNIDSLPTPSVFVPPPHQHGPATQAERKSVSGSTSLASHLVQGIPNNLALKYASTEEAISAYAEALRAGIVRRVKLQINPDGHAEFATEHLGVSSGLRDLDALSTTREGHTSAHTTGSVSLPWPGKRANDHATQTHSPSSAGLTMPKQWVMVENNRPNQSRRPSDAETEIVAEISTESSLTNTSVVPNAATSSLSSNIVVLNDESDDEDHWSRGSARDRSAHSSDKYYDSEHEKQCRAYIRAEESTLRVANVSVEI